MCCRDYGLCFGGGSYSAVYVPPPLCVFPMVLMLHIPSSFSDLCFVCSFLHSFVPLSFPSYLLCVFYMLG